MSGPFYFKNLNGTAARPIVVGAVDPTKPPKLIGKDFCIQLRAISHVEVRDLVSTGGKDNGLNIDDGDRQDRPTHHVTLRNLRISDIGSDGNSDAIKLSGVDDFRIENCTIERWGKGGSGLDMVGCHRGTIATSTFKKGGENAIQTKGGSADIVITGCRLEDAGERAINIGGRTDDARFRPPLKSLPANGKYEAKNIRVEGCTFIGGKSAIAFVGVDGAVVRYNTFYHPEQYSIRILQERSKEILYPAAMGSSSTM